jgi:hypothetical protein
MGRFELLIAWNTPSLLDETRERDTQKKTEQWDDEENGGAETWRCVG